MDDRCFAWSRRSEPADVRGQWKVALAGHELTLDIAQKHQMLTTTGARAGQAVNVIGAHLRGTEISFTAFDRDGYSRQFTGMGAAASGR